MYCFRVTSFSCMCHSIGLERFIGWFHIYILYISKIRSGQLNAFYYRGIQKNFVDMENMFDLFREHSDIKDAIGAPALLARKGAIEFRNVMFSYVPERLILNDITFSVEPGKTVALVSDFFLLIYKNVVIY